ncbi:MAG: T9SS type A sorting domain-containing protein [Ferruginibacter sp.]|nr:T9SS type A sorting domain-containing protein [Chitinophagaceae bacterium]
MKKIVLFVLSFTLMVAVTAQENNYWSLNTDAGRITTDKAVARLSFPVAFKLFNLNAEPLRQQLFSVVAGHYPRHSTVISLPNADGQIEQFEVVEASNFEAALQARFPGIRAFSGKGITDRSATLKLSISPQGIQTMVFRTEKENEFIEPYSRDHTVYAVFRSERKPGQLPWTCSTADTKMANGINAQVENAGLAGRSGGDLKTMRLAQSCNAEYSNYFGATSASQVALVLAAFNATLTRCNGVYEKDLALHLNLIANTTSVIYYNPSTDPYSTNMSQWNAQLQSTLTSVIGEANYDIGHMFGATGGGGNAGCIGCVCVNGSKGSGITSPNDGIPQGDNFDIDYVTHEVGHQLGANHTFSMSNEGTGVNKEPGSGITIMGYAGITSQDLAPHSIDIFHQASIAQIQANLATKTCPVTTTLSNATPVVATLTNYTIPRSTPFALTGSATDANPGDVLTYCWEQNDNASSGQTGANSVASATKATGPNWITFSPTTSPTRYFPKLSTILAGGLISGPLAGGDAGANTEALSSVARTLNFRLTVRDNAPYSSSAPVSVGQTQFRDMVVTVSAASGPFSVTAPNTAVSYAGGSLQTITWAVASTTAAPVSCASVKISLSTDGGQTFPTVLSASTANDGTEALVIPNTPTTTARIKVEAVGNIFFDISNTNFTITSGSSCTAPTGLAASAITTSSATVGWTAVSGALSYDVDYKTTPSGTWINAATGTTSTSVNLSGLTQSTTYDWRVRTNCSSSSSSYSAAQFTTSSPASCNAPTGLASSSVTNNSATVSWSAVSGALSYDVDYKTNASGTWINAATGTASLSVNLGGLSASTLYDWRVRTNCASLSSSYSTAQFTTQPNPSGCGTAFEPNETLATAATITAGVANSAAITTTTDNDYFRVVTTATSNNTFTLAGPSGVDFDMTIFNSGGTSIGSGTSGSANETVSLTNQAAGTYYIRVYGYNGANSATCYTITATVTPVSGGCVSTYDVSTNGTPGGAALIPKNTDIKGLISPSGDNDYYSFTIATGGTATITLTTLPGDYDIRLYSSNGTTQLAISQNGGTSSETITRTYTAGTYYVQVYGYNGANSATVCYTLRVATGTASREEELGADNHVSVFPNPVTKTVNVRTPVTGGMTDIKVFDMYGKMVMQKTSSQSNTQLDVSAFAAGVYLVTVSQDGKQMGNIKIIKE